MVPDLPQTPDDDTEFDLDVRLQAVARDVSEGPPKPTPMDGCQGPTPVTACPNC
jgi:hypothetical protein